MNFTQTLDLLQPSIHRDASLTPLVEPVIKNLRDSLIQFPYHISPSLVTILQQQGISVTQYGTKQHPHPYHKALETHLLFYHWHYLARQPSTVFYMKEEKFEKLRKNNANFQVLQNYIHTAADIPRYTKSNITYVNTPLLFIHDALMYIHPAQILDLFHFSPALNHCYASLIVPPEQIHHLQSLYPECYQLTYRPHDLVYHLEQNPQKLYEQPLSAINWLTYNQISNSDLVLTVHLLESFGPLHSILITRGAFTTPQKERFFKCPDAIELPAANNLEIPLRTRLVPSPVFHSIFSYVRSVRTLRKTDPAGHIRTLSSKPEYAWVDRSAWDYLADFALKTHEARPELEFAHDISWFSKLCFWISDRYRVIRPFLPVSSLLYYYLKKPISFAFSFFFRHRPYVYNCVPPPLIYGLSYEPPAAEPSFLVRLCLWILPKQIRDLFSPHYELIVLPYPKFQLNSLSLSFSPSEYLDLRNLAHPPLRQPTLLNFPLAYPFLTFGVLYGLYQLYRHYCTTPLTPQQRNDAYFSYFFPSPFTLSLTTQTIKCDTLMKLTPSINESNPSAPIFALPKGFSHPHADTSVLAKPLSSLDLPTAAPPSAPALPPPPAPPPPIEPEPTVQPQAPETPSKPPADQNNKLEIIVPSPANPSSVPLPPSPPSRPTDPEFGYSEVFGDLFTAPPEFALVHCVSSDLALSAGIAVQFQQHYPIPQSLRKLRPSPGTSFSFQHGKRTIFMLVTKRVCTDSPTIENVKLSLQHLASTLLTSLTYRYLAMPMIACGCDGQSWDQIRPLIHEILLPCVNAIRVYILHSRQLAQIVTPRTTPSARIPNQVQDFPRYSSLEEDNSAYGPIFTWRDQCNFDVPFGQGHFNTRRRLAGPSKPLPSTNICLLTALSEVTKEPVQTFWEVLAQELPDSVLWGESEQQAGLSTDHLAVLAWRCHLRVRVVAEHDELTFGPIDGRPITIYHTTNPLHWSSTPKLKPPSTLVGSSTKLDYSSILLNFRDKQGHYLPFKEIHRHKICPVRAKNLSSNLKNNLDGVLSTHLRKSHTNPFYSLDAIADFTSVRTVSLIHLSGFPGCGKSYPVAQLLLKHFRHQFRVAVPHLELREAWKDMLNLPPYENSRISTWETALLKNAQVLVIDEIYKLPNGYLDLALVADPSIELVIALGDPCQIPYHSTSAHSTNHTIQPEIEYLRPYRDFYALWTHRLPKVVASLLGVHTTSKEHGYVKFRQRSRAYQYHLTAATNVAQLYACSGARAITVASSQGLTFTGPANIILERNTPYLPLAAQFVAVTRSKTGVCFLGDPTFFQTYPGQCPIYQMMYNGERISIPLLFHHELAGTEIITSPLTARLRAAAFPAEAPPLTPDYDADVISRAETLFEEPGVIPQPETLHLPETRKPLHFDIPSALPEPAPISKPEPSSCPPEFAYPGEDYELAFQTLFPPHDPVERERDWKGTLSNQFPYLNEPFEIGAQPPGLVAPKHNQKKDPTLLPASISKRLRFRASNSPYAISSADLKLGRLLFDSLAVAYQLPKERKPFNESLYAECIAHNEYAQLTNKTQKTIMANAFRSDPDWRYTVVRIFSKTQHKINEDSIFGSWKACQTLALMQDFLILVFGPVKKYQRKIFETSKPENLFIYGGHTPFELSAAAQRLIPPGALKVSNDYTAFDQSQQGEAVVLEMLKMEYCNIPPHLIELHKTIKTNVESQFGPLTCMRLTGEPGTYDDNTEYSIATLFLKYDIKSESVFVSGDDSLISPPPKIRPSWEMVSPLLHVRFKTITAPHALFCGYYLDAVGAVRAPRALCAKLSVAKADDSLDDKLASYLTEFVVGHSLGDNLLQALPPEQYYYQFALFDFFCRHCTKEQKLSLRLGEVPTELCQSMLSSGLRWVSAPIFACLDRITRLRLLGKRRNLDVFLPHEHDIDYSYDW